MSPDKTPQPNADGRDGEEHRRDYKNSLAPAIVVVHTGEGRDSIRMKSGKAEDAKMRPLVVLFSLAVSTPG